MAATRDFAAYPPVLKRLENLGYVKDASSPHVSRDIGVPFDFFGNTYLIYGDTFCKNQDGGFVGVVSNTVAIIEDPASPLLSKYLEVEENGLVKAFIPLTAEEKELEKRSKGRVVLWAFGGGVELTDGTGRVWYQKSIDHGSGNCEYIGTGLAQVVSKLHGKLSVTRLGDVMFGPDEPRNGTLSTIIEDNYCYLYGDRGGNDIVLARITRDVPMDKAAYTYWNGTEYVADWKEAAKVFTGIGQGSIVRSSLFGPDKPFLFIGVSTNADSKVMMGASAALEGPWELTPIATAKGIDIRDGFTYCIYPHLWASDEENNELMVTWSEQWPGGVIMAKLKLASMADVDLEV